MFNPLVLDAGKDITFYCGGIDGRTTLTACEEFCPKYSSCDTAGMANDELAKHYGLEEIIKSVQCTDYGELVTMLYRIADITGNYDEIEKIVETLDEIDSGREY